MLPRPPSEQSEPNLQACQSWVPHKIKQTKQKILVAQAPRIKHEKRLRQRFRQTFPPNVSAKRFRQTRLIAVVLLRNTKRQTPKPFTPNVSAKRFRQIRLNVYAKRFRQNAVKRMF